MIGYHAVPVIADAYLKGIRGFDADAGARTPWSQPPTYAPYDGLGEYMQLGYVPIDRGRRGGVQDGRIRLRRLDDRAHGRGHGAHGDVAAPFAAAPTNWRNAFDPKTGFMRARRRDGASASRSIRPRAATAATTPRATPGSTPGTCRRTSPGSRAPHGGDARLVAQLDQCSMPRSTRGSFAHMEDIAGLIGRYVHGNEPSHHVAYLYAAAGQPWRTQERLGRSWTTPVRAAARRPRRQRRPRPDVGLVHLHRAGLLPGGPGEQRVRHRPPVRIRRATLKSAQRQALHRQR